MPKVNDIKAYWKEVAKAAGLDEEKLKQVSDVMDDEKFSKAFTEKFKPLPDYSHDLDTVRDKSVKDTEAKYAAWYEEEQKKYAEYLKAEAELKQYREKHGALDGDRNMNTVGLTKEEIKKMLEDEMAQWLNQRDSAYMDLLEIRESHLGTFKKPLDVKAFETAWKEHSEWGNSMKQAYKSFTEPEMEKVREADFNARLQQKYDEGIRDGFSRRSLPTDSASKTFSPLFDRKEDVAKMTEREQDTHSRNAFFDGLRDQKQA